LIHTRLEGTKRLGYPPLQEPFLRKEIVFERCSNKKCQAQKDRWGIAGLTPKKLKRHRLFRGAQDCFETLAQ
jgi:hypothetical protein